MVKVVAALLLFPALGACSAGLEEAGTPSAEPTRATTVVPARQGDPANDIASIVGTLATERGTGRRFAVERRVSGPSAVTVGCVGDGTLHVRVNGAAAGSMPCAGGSAVVENTVARDAPQRLRVAGRASGPVRWVVAIDDEPVGFPR